MSMKKGSRFKKQVHCYLVLSFEPRRTFINDKLNKRHVQTTFKLEYEILN